MALLSLLHAAFPPAVTFLSPQGAMVTLKPEMEYRWWGELPFSPAQFHTSLPHPRSTLRMPKVLHVFQKTSASGSSHSSLSSN